MIALAVAAPPDGLGFSICSFYNLTGIPCPGCGLTRSVSATLHGQLPLALYFNPFGIPIALCGAALAMSALWRALAQWILRHRAAIRRVGAAYTAAFLILGTVRAVWIAVDRESIGPFARVASDPALIDLSPFAAERAGP